MPLAIRDNLWEGVYENFAEADGDLDAFSTDIWVSKQKDRIYAALDNLNQGSFVSKDYPLPLVISMLLCEKDHISVIDFGGGMGLQYLEMIAKVPMAKDKVSYLVVDEISSIQHRPPELNQFNMLKFFSNFNGIEGSNQDIIHMGSTLQYIEDWKGLLQTLNRKFKPKYFVFSDLLAGNVPSFVTRQIFYEKKIPVNILNIEEFKDYMRTQSFCINYQTLFQNIILGNTTFPNSLLPEKNRLSMASNLIFKRSQ